uniref:Thymosin beta-12 n=1 Tax=Ciona intestinalis TaxID=7719 RepID=H2Y2S4_CIOIN|nr:thymosin beta-12 [Ciona intestinalis]|eukprot:XP_002125878.1 thymosin beta-12 [Ciona intestinalis]
MPDRPDLAEVSEFDKTNLKKAKTCEKSGAVEGYAQEKALKEIGQFQKDKLKHTDTEVKNKLPTQQEIDQEKSNEF